MSTKSDLLQSFGTRPVITAPVFGHRDILHMIQTSGIFKDSKTFIDLKLKKEPAEVETKFLELFGDEIILESETDKLKEFIQDNFDTTENAEFEDWDPTDFKDDFTVPGINEPLQTLVREIHKLWKVLSMKTATEIRENPRLSTSIALPNGFIIPGGRFKETYYWDTYWIIRGILKSNMIDTAKGIIENFLHLIEEYGFIPNGTRTYYLGRSQPPFLLSMMQKYVEKSQDLEFAARNILLLEKEVQFFEDQRSLKVTINDLQHTVFRYGANSLGPRPEAYEEDFHIAESFRSNEEREEFYLHIKSAAESGWDFSSRWIIAPDGSNVGTLKDVKTNLILPVDLNALMYKNYSILKDYFEKFGASEKSAIYQKKAVVLLNTISEIFWDADEEMWFDFDLINGSRRIYYYASNLVPLWTQAYPLDQTEQVAKAAVAYLKREGVLDHPGGLPTSKYQTGEQWDYNCWPPSQHMIVSGLNKTRDPEAAEVAFQIAKKYVMAALASCIKKSQGTCHFYEKYDPAKVGGPGGGGEYDVQVGFGWTNGVLLDLINYYGDYLITHEKLPRDVSIARHF